MITTNHVATVFANMDPLTASIILTLSVCAMVYFGIIILDTMSMLSRHASLRIWERRIQRLPKRDLYWKKQGY